MPMYSLGSSVWPMSTSRFVGEMSFIFRTCHCTHTDMRGKCEMVGNPRLHPVFKRTHLAVDDGHGQVELVHHAHRDGATAKTTRKRKKHGPVNKLERMDAWMGEKRWGLLCYQGLALSILRSNKMHSMFGFVARASAAHAPEGPPPITATLYLVPGADAGVGCNDSKGVRGARRGATAAG